MDFVNSQVNAIFEGVVINFDLVPQVLNLGRHCILMHSHLITEHFKAILVVGVDFAYVAVQQLESSMNFNNLLRVYVFELHFPVVALFLVSLKQIPDIRGLSVNILLEC